MTTPTAQRIEAQLAGLDVVPTEYTLNIGELPRIAVDEVTAHVRLDRVGADASVALAPVTADAHVALDPLSTDSHVRLEPLDATARVQVEPLAVDLGISRIPDVRAHVPAHFSFTLSLFGFPVLSLQFAGEAQVITEPYVANASERHGSVTS